MAAYEILLLNTAIPQIQAAQAGDTYVVPRDIAFSAALVAYGNAVFNENGADVDFRVEGDTDANLLFVDASTDRVGIGTNAPLARLTVSDSTVTNGTMTLGNNASYNGTLQYIFSTGELRISQVGGSSLGTTFYTNGNERLRITSTGTVNIVGGGTPGSTQAVSFNGSAPVDSLVLNSSGNLGVGTASPSSYVTSGLAVYSSVNSTQTKLAVVNPNSGGSAGAVQTFISDSDQKLELTLTSTGWGDYGTIKTRSGVLSAYGNAGTYLTVAGQAGIIFGYGANPHSEAARITSGGYFKASDNGTYTGSTSAYAEFYQSANNAGLFINTVNASFASETLALRANRNTTNNSFYAIGYYNDAAAEYKLLVADSGNVTNRNNSYGGISDQKLKSDIVDAGSQWNDIKAIKFRKFKMKNDPQQIVQLGVVAQEVELTSPGLVDEHTDRDAEGNDLGTTTKSVKTSILLMKAAVALQEAMARIEQLEAKVAALEAN